MVDRTIYQDGFTAWAPRLLLPAAFLGAAPILLLDPRLSLTVKLGTLAVLVAVGGGMAQWLLRQQVSRIVVNGGQIRMGRPRLFATRWLTVPESAFRSARYESRGTASRPLHGLIVGSREGDIFVRLNGAALATDALKRLAPEGFAAYEAATGECQHTELPPPSTFRRYRT